MKEKSPSTGVKAEDKPIWLENSKPKEREKLKDIPPVQMLIAAEIFGLEPPSEPSSPKEDPIIKPENRDPDEPSTVHYILAGERPQHQFLFNWGSATKKKKKTKKSKR